MTWGCQAGLEAASLASVMKHYEITNTEAYESIKLGIDAHAKWYWVARQLDKGSSDHNAFSINRSAYSADLSEPLMGARSGRPWVARNLLLTGAVHWISWLVVD
jgi:hypothetical protein